MRRRRLALDYVRDMLTYAEKAQGFVTGTDIEGFQRDERTVFAVVRALEVIGEAARQVPQAVRRRYADVPWSKIVGMRNIVIHGYFGVDAEVIWRTVQEDLPGLRGALARVLADLESAERGG